VNNLRGFHRTSKRGFDSESSNCSDVTHHHSIPESPPVPSSAASQPSSQQPCVLPLDSWIISDFSEIFAEFQRRPFLLRWPDNSDRFKPKEAHRRCDGHKNTLTVTLDTKQNIFGGFTPVEWELREFNWGTADDSLNSLVDCPHFR
jgi:hypothetical protein